MRLALAQLNPTVGDLDGNAAIIRHAVIRAHTDGADLLAVPELALCGYPPKDLLLHEGFILRCESLAHELGQEATRAAPGLTLVLGTPLPLRRERTWTMEGPITNSLLAFRDGQLLARYDKRLLPTYDVFDEDRYFTPGTSPCVIEVPSRHHAGTTRVGLAICEDLWRGQDAGFASHYAGVPDPVAELAKAAAQVIVVPSASPFVVGKSARHREILRTHATRQGVLVASVNQVGGNDELIFDGHAAIFDAAGTLIAAAPGFVDQADPRSLLIHDLSGGPALQSQVEPRSITSSQATGLEADATNAVHDPALTTSDESLLFRALVLGVRDYCRKCGFASALLGLSGGIDSALTAVVATAALGTDKVLGVAMPSKYSSAHSIEDARALAASLRTPFQIIAIEPGIEGLRPPLDTALADLGRSTLGAQLPDLAEENLQSRVRGTILMTLSNRTGAILLTTGNKSELAVGYCTLYGDMNGGLAVLSDLTKHWVYRLSHWCNEHWRELEIPGLSGPPIPQSTLTKAPSAELRPNQTDQDSLPPYDVVDEFIRRFIEQHQSPERIAQETGLERAAIDRLTRLVMISEYKRKQAAIGLKVTTVAFGSGRRWPIAQRYRP
jgi:NAD+ synthase (glutamine-hydrolysing)